MGDGLKRARKAAQATRAPTAHQRVPRNADCTCYKDCGADSVSGDWHQHENDPCPDCAAETLRANGDEREE